MRRIPKNQAATGTRTHKNTQEHTQPRGRSVDIARAMNLKAALLRQQPIPPQTAAQAVKTPAADAVQQTAKTAEAKIPTGAEAAQTSEQRVAQQSAKIADAGSRWNKFLDITQTALDVAGFVPGVGEAADAANIGISLARGDKLGAALSAISLVPVVGDVAGKGAKAALKLGDAKLAHEALDQLRKADYEKYIPSLFKDSVDDVVKQLEKLAGGYKPAVNPTSAAAKTAGAGFKKGDHLFNQGLAKMGLVRPKDPYLARGLDNFERALGDFQKSDAFHLAAQKGKHGADLNSQLFGGRLNDVRASWQKLDELVGNPNVRSDTLAQGVRDVTDSLKRLRASSFDDEALGVIKQGQSGAAMKQTDRAVTQAASKLDAAFGQMIDHVNKLHPPAAAIGAAQAGGRIVFPRGR